MIRCMSNKGNWSRNIAQGEKSRLWLSRYIGLVKKKSVLSVKHCLGVDKWQVRHLHYYLYLPSWQTNGPDLSTKKSTLDLTYSNDSATLAATLHDCDSDCYCLYLDARILTYPYLECSLNIHAHEWNSLPSDQVSLDPELFIYFDPTLKRLLSRSVQSSRVLMAILFTCPHKTSLLTFYPFRSYNNFLQ